MDAMNLIDFDEILQKLPHSFPFRMIDRIIEIEPGKKAVALKQVSADECYLQGYFPKELVMPGVLILEALAQTGGLAFHTSFEREGKGVPYLARVEEFRITGKVIPGDSLLLQAEIERLFSNLAKVKLRAMVGEGLVAEGVVVLAKGAE